MILSVFSFVGQQRISEGPVAPLCAVEGECTTAITYIICYTVLDILWLYKEFTVMFLICGMHYNNSCNRCGMYYSCSNHIIV